MSLPADLAARRATLLAGLALLPLAAAGGFVVLERSSAFAVHDVVVRGADERLAERVRSAALAYVDGRSLLAISPGSLARALERIPLVRSAAVDRNFPSTLRIRIAPERPAAVAISRGALAVVAADGRVLYATDRAHLPPLPHVLFEGAMPAAGERLRNSAALDGLTAVRALPADFGGRLASIRTDVRGSLVARLQIGLPIRLGPIEDVAVKLRVAARLLREYAPASRPTLRYVDVSAPDAPVVCPRGGDASTLTAVLPDAGGPDAGAPVDGTAATAAAPAVAANGEGCLLPADVTTAAASTGTATAEPSSTTATPTTSSGATTESTSTTP